MVGDGGQLLFDVESCQAVVNASADGLEPLARCRHDAKCAAAQKRRHLTAPKHIRLDRFVVAGIIDHLAPTLTQLLKDPAHFLFVQRAKCHLLVDPRPRQRRAHPVEVEHPVAQDDALGVEHAHVIERLGHRHVDAHVGHPVHPEELLSLADVVEEVEVVARDRDALGVVLAVIPAVARDADAVSHRSDLIVGERDGDEAGRARAAVGVVAQELGVDVARLEVLDLEEVGRVQHKPLAVSDGARRLRGAWSV